MLPVDLIGSNITKGQHYISMRSGNHCISAVGAVINGLDAIVIKQQPQ